ncbi:MAG: SfnB family sulfur acquisition oxidoreductase, partial [Sciscionella sp.]|nr:SfnB family sulfur acquisition oxidoreductase [Sciscionella sp.]
MTDVVNRPRTAHVIADADEALAVAARLSARFAETAATRDAERILPRAELDELSTSGLLAISVPREHGGAGVDAVTLAEVFRLLSAADPNIAQIPQSHFVYLNVVRRQGTLAQQRFLFGEVLAGKRLGNAQSEAGTKHVQDYRTRLLPHPDGGFVLDGVKHYSTGALFADWIPVLAKDADDRLVVAFVPADAPGLSIVDDWNGMGQRVTASGTVRLDGVRVPEDLVLPHYLTFTGPQLHGAQAQLLHAAIDAGIARGALTEAAEFVRTKSRPWFESGYESAAEDPLTAQRFGELEIAVRAAESLLADAARAIDSALDGAFEDTLEDAAPALDERTAGVASIAVATAKVAADRAAIEVTNALFEVAGTRSAVDSLNLHRHWRNART